METVRRICRKPITGRYPISATKFACFSTSVKKLHEWKASSRNSISYCWLFALLTSRDRPSANWRRDSSSVLTARLA